MLDRFYPIVETSDWVLRLAGAGAKLIQLRMKNQDLQRVRTEICAAKKICIHAGAQLIVNDFWEIAMEEKCDFVHLGYQDVQSADLSALKKANVRIGISTHSHEELEFALKCRPDYIALGPIYPTLLKKMPWTPQGLSRIGEWKRLIGKISLVAIGGITLERALDCLKAGADSVAVVSDIVRAENPEVRAAAWIETIRQAA
jgi:thiamine-phosphate pyrophosphorylase